MKCRECGAQVGQEPHHPLCPDDPENNVRTVAHPNTLTVASCPHCGEPDVVRLADDWQERVKAGTHIPVIGCGAPWHYVTTSLGDAPKARDLADVRV